METPPLASRDRRRVCVNAPSMEGALWSALHRLGLEPQHGEARAVLSVRGPHAQPSTTPLPTLSLDSLPEADALQREIWRLCPHLDEMAFGPVRVELSTRTVHMPERRHSLSPTELRLLLWFRGRPDQILTAAELLREVWGYRAGVQTRTLVSTMHRLRSKLELDPSHPQLLLTEVGLGYRMSLHEAIADTLLGRTAELRQLAEQLRPGVRTVVGPGGVGKTTLVRTAYEQLRPRFVRAAWVELLGLVTQSDLLSALAGALGIPASLGVLQEYLAESPALLVLDNAEGLNSELLALLRELDLSQTCVLVTSREPLGMGDTLTLRGLPDPQATELLLGHARALRSDYGQDPQAVAELVSSLDGLPLAIELAAAQARLLTPAQLLERLRHHKDLRVPSLGRHGSLLGVIRENIASLGPAQLRALQSLVVFDGPASAPSVESLTGEDLLMELQELLERALVREEHGRLRLLEMVRLALPAPTPPRVEAHARWLLRMNGPLREWSAALRRTDGALHAELLASVGDRLVDQGQLGLLAGQLSRAHPGALDPAQRAQLDILRARVLQEQGQAREARDALLRLIGGPVDTEARLQAAELSLELQDASRTQALVEGLQGDEVIALRVRLCQGGAAFTNGQLEPAEAAYSEALELARRTEDPLWVCRSLYALSVLPFARGRFREMVDLLQEARTLSGDNARWRALTEHRLGLAFHRLGRTREALEAMRKAEDTCRRAGLYRVAASMLCDRAGVLAEVGQEAEGTIRQALHLSRRFELPLYQQTSLVSLISVLFNRLALDEAERCLVELDRSLLQHPNPLLSAVSTGHRGVLLHKRGQHLQALAALSSAADAMRDHGHGARAGMLLGRQAWIHAQLGDREASLEVLACATEAVAGQDAVAQLVDVFALRTREALGEDVAARREELQVLARERPRLQALLEDPGGIG